jgi:hypothetical protein
VKSGGFMEKYHFRLAKENEIDDVLYLIQQRIKWMDEVGIEQWNKTDYMNCYPKTYFKDCVTRRNLYILFVAINTKVVGAVVLLAQDKRWHDDADALYIHNLVTALGKKRLGELLLKNCENVARQKNKQRLRLDCQAQNVKLNVFYEKMGFDYIDQVQDGQYQGNKREKALY